MGKWEQWCVEMHRTGIYSVFGLIERYMDNQEIIAAVNWWQAYPLVHELTCRNDSKHAILVPREMDHKVILVCPDCDYVQSWIPECIMEAYKNREEIEEQGRVFLESPTATPVERAIALCKKICDGLHTEGTPPDCTCSYCQIRAILEEKA